MPLSFMESGIFFEISFSWVKFIDDRKVSGLSVIEEVAVAIHSAKREL
jgi:hypothetical protein